MIVNYGDTPASFAFQTSGLGPCFAIKPSQGIVPAKGNVLVRGRRKLGRSWECDVQGSRPALFTALLTIEEAKTYIVCLKGRALSSHPPRPVSPLCRLVSGSARRMPSPPPAAPRARSMASR